MSSQFVPSPVDLVWLTHPERETEWVKYLLGDTIGQEAFLTELGPPRSDTLYILNSNKLRLRELPASFLAQVAATPRVGLLHLADEWFAGNYDVYRHFDFVIRPYHPTRFRHPGLHVIPLGPTNGTVYRQSLAEIVPATRRRHSWSFLGVVSTSSRPEMYAAFQTVPGGFTYSYSSNQRDPNRRLMPKSEYNELLDQSVFAPCPMGNVMVETFRIYEALESGAIPISEDRILIHYFDELLGKNPIPRFQSWSQAAGFARAVLADGQRLDALQREIFTWWVRTREGFRARTVDFVRRGLAGEFAPALEAYRYGRRGWRQKLDQYGELAKHHSPPAARRRAMLIVKRLVGLAPPSPRDRRPPPLKLPST